MSAIGALIGTSLADKVGRRRMWFWGTLASAGTLAVTTGTPAIYLAKGVSKENHLPLLGRMHRPIWVFRK